jgi:archaellum component FlaC
MDEEYNVRFFNHIANTERVINNQIEELKTEISCLTFEMEKISRGPNELASTEGRVAELTYQINKLKLQLERLTKED